ncbi:glutaredoxin family protein [Ottowia thiooxydans]|uniref:Glutaredoxin n=1 Tax=Ottowia thiooxydans TaxID=219182 RepID=A0ABV2QGV0_9BURK
MRFLPAHCLAAVLAALLVGHVAQAQQLYRSVGPDGRVTYSDKPPASNAPNNRAPATGTTGSSATGGTSSTTAGAPAGDAALPFELRQTAQRYPVTLYTSAECVPCNSGRNLLINRGVPFTEKTISTSDDLAALHRATGNNENSMPQLTIGGQQLRGFSDSDWSQYLDAAGYPKTSQLPASYRRPAVTPLVPVQVRPVSPGASSGALPAASEPSAEQSPSAPEVAPQPSPANPSGIRF